MPRPDPKTRRKNLALAGLIVVLIAVFYAVSLIRMGAGT